MKKGKLHIRQNIFTKKGNGFVKTTLETFVGKFHRWPMSFKFSSLRNTMLQFFIALLRAVQI